MGMYNEVKAPCPNCNISCEMQIPQVVLGFGNFDLSNPGTTKELTIKEKNELADYVNNREFQCEEHGYFSVYVWLRHNTNRYII